MLLTAILAALHIFFAVAWLGGGVMFGMIIAPRLAKLSLGSSSEFFIKVVPTVHRYFTVVPVLTVVFGLLLLGNMVDGNWSMLTPSTAWGFDVSFGMAFAILALIISEAGAVPPLGKVIRILTEMQASGSKVPPPELPRTLKRAGQMAMVTAGLLLVTLGFMVGAGFY